MTAPVSAGSVSTRMAASRAEASCSGRFTRSKYLERGRNASLTVTSPAYGCSSSCRTGLEARVAKVPDGNSSTGIRLIVASAAPVSMLVDPGPTDAVHTHVCSRSFCRAYATEVCTMACSFRARTYGRRSSPSVVSSFWRSAWPIPATFP